MEKLEIKAATTGTSAPPRRPAPDRKGAVGSQAKSMSHAEFRKVLHTAGYSATRAQSVLEGLPDPIDFDRNGEALLKRGVSLDRLMDAVGGSP